MMCQFPNQVILQEARMRELANSRQSINRLPCEVLAHIFVLCKRTKSRKQGHPDIFCLTSLPSICRHWRKVALDTKLLWSLITLSERPPFHFSALCLDRSGMTTPLDIEIRLSINLLCTQTKRDLNATHTLLDGFNFIVAHGGATFRWRSFWLYTPASVRIESHITALDFIGKYPMPSLERLEVKDDGLRYEGAEEHRRLGEILHNRALVYNPPPTRLKFVTLEWIPNSYPFASLGRPHLVGLTRLEISFSITLPKLEHINALLAANLTLRALSIDTRLFYYILPDDSKHTELAHLPRIKLPNLKALALSFSTRSHDLWWEQCLLRMLDAPKVGALRLRLQMPRSRPAGIRDFVDCLTKGADLSNLKPLFPSLTGLELLARRRARTSPFIDSFDKELLAAYPTITTLVLPHRSQSTMLNIQPWLVPRLNRLLIHVDSAAELKQIIGERCKAGLGPNIVEVPSTGVSYTEWVQSASQELDGLGVDVRASYSSRRVREVLGFEEP
ncbi:hypothetical protein ACGC1H_007192 [Rhizoctonia solani]